MERSKQSNKRAKTGGRTKQKNYGNTHEMTGMLNGWRQTIYHVETLLNGVQSEGVREAFVDLRVD